MSKGKKPVPVSMPKKASNKIVVMTSKEATLAQKPYYTVGFKTGRHMSEKDRPRDRNWRKWLDE